MGQCHRPPDVPLNFTNHSKQIERHEGSELCTLLYYSLLYKTQLHSSDLTISCDYSLCTFFMQYYVHDVRHLSLTFTKNVLQFLLTSARGRIPCNLVPKYRVHLAVHLGAGIKHFPQHMKLHHCSYISMSFLQHILWSL